MKKAEGKRRCEKSKKC